MSQDRDARRPVFRSAAPSQDADVFGTADVFSTPAVRAPERAVVREAEFDPARIMASIGETPYEWSIESDVLAWGANATEVLNVNSLAAISSGRNYAKLLAADTAGRFDVVMKSQERDGGTGVPYQLQYALQPPGADKALWIEDIGHNGQALA